VGDDWQIREKTEVRLATRAQPRTHRPTPHTLNLPAPPAPTWFCHLSLIRLSPWFVDRSSVRPSCRRTPSPRIRLPPHHLAHHAPLEASRASPLALQNSALPPSPIAHQSGMVAALVLAVQGEELIPF
jgi:hypothetical protein